MKTSPVGRKLIQGFEGYRSEAYICPAGVWTIGYGHTKGVKEGDTCTREQADIFLQEDLKTAEDAVNAQNLKLGQLQFDALVSFVYNVGAGAFESSTLLKKLKISTAATSEIEAEWKKWKYANKVELKGLVRRRAAEYALYKRGFFLLTLPIVILAAIVTVVIIKNRKK